MRPTTLTAVALCGAVALAGCSAPQSQPPTSRQADQVVADSGEPTAGVGEEDGGLLVATAELRDPAGKPRGVAEFHEIEGGVEVVVEGSGLTPGFHGLHLHAVGRCEAGSADPKDPSKKGDFLSAGGHLGDGKHPAHAGDLPALLVKKDGTGFLTVHTDRVVPDTLLDDDGTAVVVHGGPDNLANVPERYAAGGPDAETAKAGDSGPRVACGVVEAP